MSKHQKIFVAGHRGLVGAALVRRLRASGGCELVLRDRSALDLRDQLAVRRFFESERPDAVYLAAGRVGGIKDNSDHPAEFIHDNLLIVANVIDAAYRVGSKKALYLGSSCIYPRLATQPIQPESLLSGPLEPTNRAYAIAKIAGIEMCRAYRRQYEFPAISAMPTNLYGPGDNFHPERSHVLPALLQRFAAAATKGDKEVVVWGSGQPLREFLFVDDLADALVAVMDRYDSAVPINIGSGEERSIAEVAELVAATVGYQGRIVFDPSMPDGTPRKILDSSVVRALGWRPKVSLAEGLRRTWEWYVHERPKSVGID
jgi:GDP-L-fucose synthase